jgi:hypothetical protein
MWQIGHKKMKKKTSPGKSAGKLSRIWLDGLCCHTNLLKDLEDYRICSVANAYIPDYWIYCFGSSGDKMKIENSKDIDFQFPIY